MVVGVADDDGDDAVDDESTTDVGVVVGAVEAAELATDVGDEAVSDAGLSDAGGVVEVFSGGVPGVLVGSMAGTSAADDGGTV